jgi:hypothetical protein
MMAYHDDYPTEPIGGGNPYYRCVFCKLSVPQINGDLNGHDMMCQYRQEKEKYRISQKDFDTLLDETEREELQIFSAVPLANALLLEGDIAGALTILRIDMDKIRTLSEKINEVMKNQPNA